MSDNPFCCPPFQQHVRRITTDIVMNISGEDEVINYCPFCGKEAVWPEPDADVFPRWTDVAGASTMTGLSRPTIRKYVRKGRFPKPLGLGGAKWYFPIEELKSWMRDKENGRFL